MYRFTPPACLLFFLYKSVTFIWQSDLTAALNRLLNSSREIERLYLIYNSPCQRSYYSVVGVTTEEFDQSVKSPAAKDKGCRAHDIER